MFSVNRFRYNNKKATSLLTHAIQKKHGFDTTTKQIPSIIAGIAETSFFLNKVGREATPEDKVVMATYNDFNTLTKQVRSDNLERLYRDNQTKIDQLIENCCYVENIAEKFEGTNQKKPENHRERVALAAHDLTEVAHGTTGLKRNMFNSNAALGMASSTLVTTANGGTDTLMDLSFTLRISNITIAYQTDVQRTDAETFVQTITAIPKDAVKDEKGTPQNAWGFNYLKRGLTTTSPCGENKSDHIAQVADDLVPLYQLEQTNNGSNLMRILRECGTYGSEYLKQVIANPIHNQTTGKLKYPLPTITKALEKVGVQEDKRVRLACRMIHYYIYYRQTANVSNYELQKCNLGMTALKIQQMERQIAVKDQQLKAGLEKEKNLENKQKRQLTDAKNKLEELQRELDQCKQNAEEAADEAQRQLDEAKNETAKVKRKSKETKQAKEEAAVEAERELDEAKNSIVELKRQLDQAKQTADTANVEEKNTSAEQIQEHQMKDGVDDSVTNKDAKKKIKQLKQYIDQVLPADRLNTTDSLSKEEVNTYIEGIKNILC